MPADYKVLKVSGGESAQTAALNGHAEEGYTVHTVVWPREGLMVALLARTVAGKAVPEAVAESEPDPMGANPLTGESDSEGEWGKCVSCGRFAALDHSRLCELHRAPQSPSPRRNPA